MLQPQLWRYGSMVDQFPSFFRFGREMKPIFPTLAYGTEFPAMNVWLGADDAIVTAELPGIDPNDIDISVAGDLLKISGRRAGEKLEEGERCYQQERSMGAFARSVQLPFQVDASRVEAKYEKGILQVVLPRSEADKPKKISVKKD